MSYRSLAEFVDELQRGGELVRITAEVDRELEICEITRRLQMEDGPAVLFAKVRHSEMPVLANLFGTERRVALALGASSLSEAAARLEAAWREPARSWFDQLRQYAGLGNEGPLGRATDQTPRLIKQGACQQVVRLSADVNLNDLPALRLWPEDRHARLNAATVWTSQPDHDTASARPTASSSTSTDEDRPGPTNSGAPSQSVFSRHDCVVLDRRRLAICCREDDVLAEHLRLAEAQRTPLPAAVTLGGDPANLLAALAPLPPQSDRALFAAYLRGKPLELVECRTMGLHVSADSELVIEGHIHPAQRVQVGKLSTAGGIYVDDRPLPVMEVSAITHRINPVFSAVVVGPPPNELAVASDAMLRLTLPMIRRQVPELVDLAWTDFGRGPLVVAAIRKQFPYHGRKVAAALWGYLPLMRTRLLVLVDAEADVREPAEILGRIAAHCDAGHDVVSFAGPGGDTNPLGQAGVATALAIDATAKLPAECPNGYPQGVRMSDAVRELVTERWLSYGFSKKTPDADRTY